MPIPIIDLYGCGNCVSALGLDKNFYIGSDLFRTAMALAREDVSKAINRGELVNPMAFGLYGRRAFVSKAYELRNREARLVPLNPADTARFDSEKDKVRAALIDYSMQVEEGVGLDPALWIMRDLECMLPQTREYVLTFAATILKSQDDASRRTFGNE